MRDNLLFFGIDEYKKHPSGIAASFDDHQSDQTEDFAEKVKTICQSVLKITDTSVINIDRAHRSAGLRPQRPVRLSSNSKTVRLKR